jgi:hypothetical protein
MQLDLAHTVSGIVDSLLPQMKTDKVVSIGFDYRVSDNKGDNIFSADVYFLFIRGGNYMKVVTWIDSDVLPKPEKKIWTLQSYHDSCWISDGFTIFDDIRRAHKLGFEIGGEHVWLKGFNLLEPNQVANVIYQDNENRLRKFVDDSFVSN